MIVKTSLVTQDDAQGQATQYTHSDHNNAYITVKPEWLIRATLGLFRLNRELNRAKSSFGSFRSFVGRDPDSDGPIGLTRASKAKETTDGSRPSRSDKRKQHALYDEIEEDISALDGEGDGPMLGDIDTIDLDFY
ncbi:hypothetical protein R6Q59_027493 [Mikania micrantha]